ncbi:MAG: MFS transporter [Chloroflexota bacterium]
MQPNETERGRFYYGWYIAMALALTETVSYGIMLYAFTVYILPMEAELGWSRAQITGAISLKLLVAGAMAFPVGWWVDRHGARLLMTVGSIGATALVIAWSQGDTLWMFYLIFAGMGVCSAMVHYEPAFAVVATWFIHRRTAAMAIITFAAGLASTIFIPLADALLNLMGWRNAVLVLGITLGILTILPHAIVLRRRPSDIGLLPDGGTLSDQKTGVVQRGVSLRAALHSRYFWMLTLAFTLAGFAAAGVRQHFIPLLVDRGMGASAAAFASGSIGIMQVVGRVVFAPLDMRFPARAMAAGVFALQIVALGILLSGASLIIVGVFVVAFGTSVGAMTLARPSIIAERFGSASYGQISSVMAIFLTLGATAAPVVTGLLYDLNGNYTLALWMASGFAASATAVMIFSRPDAHPASTIITVPEAN